MKNFRVVFNEQGNGFASLIYDGIEIGTAYLFGKREATAIAKLAVKLNGREDDFSVANTTQYLYAKSEYYRNKHFLKNTKDPFAEEIKSENRE